MASHKVFTPSKDMGRSGQVSAAPNVSKPGDGSGQILRDVEAAHVLSQFYLALTGAPEKGTRKELQDRIDESQSGHHPTRQNRRGDQLHVQRIVHIQGVDGPGRVIGQVLLQMLGHLALVVGIVGGDRVIGRQL